MKSASGALITLLNGSTQFLMAELYTITLAGGTVLRYTSADVAIVSGSNTFIANDVLISRGKIRNMAGLEVDTLEVEVSASPANMLAGAAWLAAARQGALDGAQVKLERAFMPAWGDTSAGTLVMFAGEVGDVAIGRMSAKLKVLANIAKFDTQLPRVVYQQACGHTLYDSGCALNRSAWAVSATVGAGATVTTVPVSAANADGYFDLGSAQFTSGANAGAVRTVKRHASGALTLMAPLFNAPANGDAVTIYPGCDKTRATCTNKFANLPNYGGFPYVPAPEVLL